MKELTRLTYIAGAVMTESVNKFIRKLLQYAVKRIKDFTKTKALAHHSPDLC